MNFVSYVRLRAQAQPKAPSVRSGDEVWTYEELLDDVRRLANVLADDGVGEGDTCALLLPNQYEFVVGTLATLARKAVVTPVNPEFRDRELGHILSEAEPSAVFGSTTVADAADHVPDDAVWYDVDGGDRERPSLADAMAAADDDYRIPPTLDDRRAFLLYTSGTTGRPKGAIHSQDNFIAVSDACMLSYDLKPGDGFLAAMPMYHCTGMSILGTTLKAGGELVLMDEWEPRAALQAIEEFGINVFSGVPTMFRDWLAVEGSYDTSSMHTGVIGGSGTTADLVERAEALLGCPVLNGYGMTESFIAGIWENRRDERRLPSVGRIEDGLVEATVVDPETGEEQPADEPGELLLRGRPMMEGYLGRPEQTAAVFDDDGWFHTGDWARRDDDDFLYVIDRMDYTIISGGHNIYPQEVEGTIEELDAVDRAVVVATEDDRKGQKPVALVRATNGAMTAQEVKDHCLDRLAPYKHPREVWFVDSFPLNDVGKVDREELSERV